MSRELEPENEYLWVSEKPAWSALHKWIEINPELAYFTFRNACGLTPHPSELHGLKIGLNPIKSISKYPISNLEQIAFHPMLT